MKLLGPIFEAEPNRIELPRRLPAAGIVEGDLVDGLIRRAGNGR